MSSSARGRRDDRIANAHAAATAPNRWRCRVDGCPDVGQWVPAFSRADAFEEADRHYETRHAQPLDSARPTASH